MVDEGRGEVGMCYEVDGSWRLVTTGQAGLLRRMNWGGSLRRVVSWGDCFQCVQRRMGRNWAADQRKLGDTTGH
jgi:hypothetical protein